jgi:cystathionine gamma-lyase
VKRRAAATSAAPHDTDEEAADMADYGDGTRAVHAGWADPVVGAPLLPGPVFAAPFHLAGEPGAGEPIGYARADNPTYQAFERAVGDLENGDAVVFASGMAAVSALFFAVLRAGDTVVIPSDGYYEVRSLAREHLAGFDVTIREVPTGELYGAALDGAALVLAETPANPGLDVCDLAGLSHAVHTRGGLLAVDNTTATPLGQRPLDLGADFSVASDTKALSGHSDLLLGHVAARDATLVTRLRDWRRRSGSIPGPFETWLAHRSLGTLDLRLARQAENALALAEVLRTRPEVDGLRYPGLPGDPAHALASKQMRRFGGVLSFTLPDAAFVERLLDASALVTAATSFGGLHTTLDRRAQWGGDAVPEGFVRLSAGVEDTRDLVADLIAALDTAR